MGSSFSHEDTGAGDCRSGVFPSLLLLGEYVPPSRPGQALSPPQQGGYHTKQGRQPAGVGLAPLTTASTIVGPITADGCM